MTFIPTAVNNPIADRRQRNSDHTSTYFAGNKRVFDDAEQIEVVKIFSGDWYVTQNNEMLATILGSCVAACVRDPVAGVGGMNHFLLPGNESTALLSDAARYGVFAMESLINGVLKGGGHRDRLEIKVFGGGNVINNSARIGSKNAAFIRTFLQREGLRIASEDLEGDLPRRVHYWPLTGRVMMRKLRRKDDMTVLDEEKRYQTAIAAKPIDGSVELF
jgi:chemotaxis protein CheD